MYTNVRIISDYKEYHTDATVKFVVTMSANNMADAVATGIHKKFKLGSGISTNNMVSACIIHVHSIMYCAMYK